MEKVLIYPYDEESLPIIRHRDLLNNFEIISLVSPNGWGITGDVYEGFKVTSNFENELESCSMVWIVDSNRKLDVEKLIYPKVLKAVEKGKKILCTRKMDEKQSESINSIVPKDKLLTVEKELRLDDYYSNNEVYDIDTPIIFICSVLENLDKYNIQLALRKEFLQRDCKLLQIGSRDISELFGFYSIPEFMYSHNISEKNKIELFNKFIKRKEVEEKPDLIIIGIPGETLGFSRKIVGNFGIMLHEIAQTIYPDCTILSLPCSDYINEISKEVSKIIKNKLNIDIDYYNISEKFMDIQDSELNNEFRYITVNKEFVSEKIKKSNNLNMFNLYEDGQDKILVDKIIDQLSGYACINSI